MKPKKTKIEIALQDAYESEDQLLFPFRFKKSGLYVKSKFPIFKAPKSRPVKTNGPLQSEGNYTSNLEINLDNLTDEGKEDLKIFPFLQYEEFRFDVDGHYPQMMASGHVRFPNVYYIAKLTQKSNTRYYGKIWYKYGNTASFPYTKIRVDILNYWSTSNRKVRVKFYGAFGSSRVRTYKYKSPYFHNVNLEYDCEQGTTAGLTYNLQDHPNRPSSLPNQTVSIDTIWRRSGMDVSRGNDNTVSSALAGANGQWSNGEMHDAMQVYWSRFQNAPQWSLWTFFAKMHESGPNLGGIMFDSIGPNHRQGTAVFNNSFINNAPAGDPDPSGFIRRTKFWTAVHEMGHSFNLAHSFQKSIGQGWIPLVNENEARSFMNYPPYVAGGENAFYSSFEFRFSDNELLFMRHAPSPFVQMGNSAWFVNHGFSNDLIDEGDDIALEVRLNKSQNVVEYMEPLYVEVKMSNITDGTIEVEKYILNDFHDLLIEITDPSGNTKICKSFVQHLFKPETFSLKSQDSIYHSHFISAGSDGWYIKESGNYKVRAIVLKDDKKYTSDYTNITVLPPQSEVQATMANQYFTNDVSRVLYFNGSRVLNEGNDILESVVKTLPGTNVSIHAAVSLAYPMIKDYKVLEINEDAVRSELLSTDDLGKFKTIKSDKIKAKKLLELATKDLGKFMDTYGHIASEELLLNTTGVIYPAKERKVKLKDMIDLFEKRGVSKKVIADLKKNL